MNKYIYFDILSFTLFGDKADPSPPLVKPIRTPPPPPLPKLLTPPLNSILAFICVRLKVPYAYSFKNRYSISLSCSNSFLNCFGHFI